MNNGNVQIITTDKYLPGINQYFIEYNQIDVFYIPHLHYFYEIELVTGGEGYEEIGDKTYEIKKGDITIMVPNEMHSYICKNDEVLKIISIKVSPGLLPEELSMLGKSSVINSLSDDDYELTIKLCDKINSYKKEPAKPFSFQIVKECINMIILNCLSLRNENERELISAPEFDRYRRALLYIHKNFRSNISVADIAREVYLAPNYFSSYFEKNMGMSCSKYINKLRLELAYEYITSTKMTLKEIYISCGFKSFSYFSNVFKNRYGHSPGYYRKTPESLTTQI